MKPKKHWKLYFDGACKPINPGGIATYGFVVVEPHGGTIKTDSGFVVKGKDATNNVAEFAALDMGLKWLTSANLDVDKLLCLGDSALVVNTVTGRWKCHKPHLKAYCDRIRSLLEQFPNWHTQWVPRDENSQADHLSSQAYYTYLENNSKS